MTSPSPPPRVPPRFVPTLTQVVQLPEAAAAPAVVTNRVPERSLVDEPEAIAPRLREEIIHRVMQRVDATLARDLKAAVAELVVTHTQMLEPLLREEIERAVRRSVEMAVSEELRDRTS